MTTFLHCMFLLGLICHFQPTGASPHSGPDSADCSDQQYPNGDFCCAKCPAGTRLLSKCTSAGRRGTCEQCSDGFYTEHASEETQCFKCTQCHSDQELVRPCSPTQDAQCQCRAGRFCHPDEPCEVCKKCSSCGKDEETVRSCSPTTNTQCKAVQSKPAPASAKASLIVPLLLIAVLTAVSVLVVVLVLKRRRETGSQRDPTDGLKVGQLSCDNFFREQKRNGETVRPSSSSLSHPLVRVKPWAGLDDERRVLCESLSSSASNSQHSLSTPPPLTQPLSREEEKLPKFVPVNGEESLRKCFEYFEEMDIDYHKRFFRHLGIMDNVIKSKEHLAYEDKIHELLNIWVEKEGLGASFNDLLKALRDLNQRRTAETIADNAINDGHYLCDE